MSAEAETLVRRVFHEGSSERNPRAVLDELFSADFRCHGPPEMQHSHAGGSEGIETCIFNDAFAALSFAVSAISSEADRVVVHFEASGRQVKEFRGVAPADQDVALSGIATFRVAERKIVEAWGSLNWD